MIRNENETFESHFPPLASHLEPVGKDNDTTTLVAFGLVEHLVLESVGTLALQFVRRGNLDTVTTVQWKTHNVNMLAETYYEQGGSVTFEVGETKKEDTLVIEADLIWTIETIQVVELLPPEDSTCVLGELFKTSVVRLDTGLFPGPTRECWNTSHLGLPSSLPYDEALLAAALQRFLQGQTAKDNPGDIAQSGYEVNPSDIRLKETFQSSPVDEMMGKCRTIQVSIGCALHSSKELRNKADSLLSGTGELSSVYAALLKAAGKLNVEDPHEYPQMTCKKPFVEGFSHSVIWLTLRYLYGFFRYESNIAMVIKLFKAASWVVQQFFILVAVNSLVKGKMTPLYYMAAVYVADLLLQRYLSIQMVNLRLGGKAKTLLRKAALSTMLQLSIAERERIVAGQAVTTIISHVEEVVANGWLPMFELAEGVALLVCMSALSYYTVGFTGLLVAVGLGVINLGVFYIRYPQRLLLLVDLTKAEDVWKDGAMEAANKRDLITMYRQGRASTDLFAAKHQVANNCNIGLFEYSGWTQFYVGALSAGVLLFGYLYFGQRVISGLDPGNFVSFITIIMMFDSQICAVMNHFEAIISTFDSLVKLASLLNATTRRNLLLRGRERRMRLFEQTKDMDMEAITVSPFTEVSHTVTNSEGVQAQSVLRFPVDGISLDQGHVVVVHSQKKAQGKSTFLKALARIYLPSDGFIFYPENLRFRYLSAEPEILTGTVAQNVLFGNQHEHDPEDIQKLCHLVGISTYLWDDSKVVEEEDGTKTLSWGQTIVGANGEKLSMTDRIRITLVRALLSSVDLLLLNNTLDLLQPKESMGIVHLLQEFCIHKGMPCLKSDMSRAHGLRKKKTVLISTRHSFLEELVTARIEISQDATEQAVASGLVELRNVST